MGGNWIGHPPVAVAEARMDVHRAQERRVVSETGGAKGQKLAAYHLIPQDVLWRLAEHYGRGARKYDERNWERGYPWSSSAAALQRHFASFWNGDDIDHDPSLYVEGEEHTSRHIDAVVWHAVCLSAFDLRHIGTDDRPKIWSPE